MSPYFSVIIPTLNEATFLPKLLGDLTKQTNQDFEVIVVDGKSKDRTVAKAEDFRNEVPSLTLLTTSKHNVSYQRNLGAKNAYGKILLFLDADSGLPPFFLDGIKYKLSKNPADVFTAWIKPDSQNPQDSAIATIVNLSFEASRLLDIPTGFGAMLGFKKAAFAKLGGFNEHITYAEDQEIIRRTIEQKLSFTIYPDPHYIYSFRRLRKQGTLGTFRQFAKLQTKLAIQGYPNHNKKDYPMGGHYFNDYKRKSTILDKIKQLLA